MVIKEGRNEEDERRRKMKQVEGKKMSKMHFLVDEAPGVT